VAETFVRIHRRPRGRTAVVSLPFFTPFSSCYPALLLGSIAETGGVQADVVHAYVDFPRRFWKTDGDVAAYKSLTHNPFVADACLLPLLDQWETGRSPELERFASACGAPPPAFRSRLRAAFSRYLDELCDRLAGYDVVALTATHYQLVPSLLLAERLKRLGPSAPRVILGGYLSSPETAALLLEHHRALDAVVFGEAEAGWAPALDAVQSGERALIRGGGSGFGAVIPDHGPFLEDVSRVPWLASRLQVSLEVSRGCYWDKCDFCNFNVGYEGRFKSFPPETVLAEMDRLRSLYGQRRFQFLDTALPRRFARWLRQHDVVRDFEVFCEIRPDFASDDLEALTRLGRVRVQLGVETLVESHLARMNKNCTVADNVRALLDCERFGIPATWGVFVGHPGETARELEQLLERTRSWRHLPAPKYVTECEVRAGSRLWEQRDELGLEPSFPWRAFDVVLPPVVEASEFVPVAVRVPGRGPRNNQLIADIRCSVQEWQQEWQQQQGRPAAPDGAGRRHAVFA
jgi:Ni,Fe-hydrogenase III small subunit